MNQIKQKISIDGKVVTNKTKGFIVAEGACNHLCVMDNAFKMIDEVGVVGVHFPGFLRYAVCADITAMMGDLEAAFRRAEVKYT